MVLDLNPSSEAFASNNVARLFAGCGSAVICTSHSWPETDDNGLKLPFMFPARVGTKPDLTPNIPLALTARMGVPLYYCAYTDNLTAEMQKALDGLKLETTPVNRVLQLLSTTSPDAESTQLHCSEALGNVMLARVDGKDIEFGIVEAICLFVEVALRHTREMSQSMKIPRSFLFDGFTTREQFVSWWAMVGKTMKSPCECPEFGIDNTNSTGAIPTALETHTEAIPKGYVKAVTCFPFTLPPGPPLTRQEIRSDQRGYSRDCLLHATARLGLPLYFHAALDDPSYGMNAAELQMTDNRMRNCGIVPTPTNMILHHLSTKTSPDSQAVAHTELPGISASTICLLRVDGEDLSTEQVHYMWTFIDELLGHPSSLHTQLTPEKFIEYWEMLRTGEDCPVKKGCKACGKEGKGQLRCGKCGVVKYCDKKCQKEDWATHKKVCVKP